MDISSGEHALIPASPRDFADAVLHLLRDDSLWEKLSLNGLALAERLYSYDRVAERFHRMLSDIGVPVRNSRDADESRVAPLPIPITVLPNSSVHIVSCTSQDEYHLTVDKRDPTSRLAQEQHVVDYRPFSIPGYCRVCGSPSRFEIDYINGSERTNGLTIPNWRETFTCRKCRLNCRTRASIDLWTSRFSPRREHSVYLTEQATPLYQWITRAYTQTVGSEYLGNTVSQGDVDQCGLRNESLLRLTFPDSSFEWILSFDVLEHIPDYSQALQECFRTLKPGGVLLFTVPFLRESEETVVRARVDARGQIEHILPPEYHGDPMNSAGCLCFYHFGWDLLDALKEVGFTECFAHFVWSDDICVYLGEKQVVFSGRRASH
ncbi:MAG: methyltransferase domain-containing protein [Gammaproteobacteria bacterium]